MSAINNKRTLETGPETRQMRRKNAENDAANMLCMLKQQPVQNNANSQSIQENAVLNQKIAQSTENLLQQISLCKRLDEENTALKAKIDDQKFAINKRQFHLEMVQSQNTHLKSENKVLQRQATRLENEKEQLKNQLAVAQKTREMEQQFLLKQIYILHAQMAQNKPIVASQTESVKTAPPNLQLEHETPPFAPSRFLPPPDLLDDPI